jgi:hypothetical protein
VLRVNIQDCYLPKLSQKPNYSFNKQDFNIRAVIDMKRDNLFYREIREVLLSTEIYTTEFTGSSLVVSGSTLIRFRLSYSAI